MSRQGEQRGERRAYERLIELLKRQRQTAGLSQSELARLVGRKQQQIGALERGVNQARLSFVEELASAMDGAVVAGVVPKGAGAEVLWRILALAHELSPQDWAYLDSALEALE